jgi:hypothetical protein
MGVDYVWDVTISSIRVCLCLTGSYITSVQRISLGRGKEQIGRWTTSRMIGSLGEDMKMHDLRKELEEEAEQAIKSNRAFSEWTAREVAGYHLRSGDTFQDVPAVDLFYSAVQRVMQLAAAPEECEWFRESDGCCGYKILPDGRAVSVWMIQFGNYGLHLSSSLTWGVYDDIFAYRLEETALEEMEKWNGIIEPSRWDRHLPTARRREYDKDGTLIREWVEL